MLPRNSTKKRKGLRSLHGLQKELAEKYNLSQKHVCQLVNGHVEAKTATARSVMRDYQRAVQQYTRALAG